MTERGGGRETTRRWRLVRASGAAVPASVRRFNERARQRRVAAARPWALAALAMVLIGSMSWLVFGSSVLGVDTVRVVGNGFLAKSDVRAAAAIRSGAPLASLNTRAVARRVRDLAPVAGVQVSRQWPHTVVITVVLRQPVAAVPIGNAHEYMQLDAAGVPFRSVSSPGQLPIIVPASADFTDASVRSALTAAAQVLVALPSALRNQLVKIDAPSDTGVELLLNEGRRIIWGDSSDNEQKARVAESLLNQPGKVIDVSAPTVVTVK